MMPLEAGIREYFGRSSEEALQWIQKIREETEEAMSLEQSFQIDPNKPGPQNGSGVNPQKKGSDTGLKNFSSPTNKKGDPK